MKKFSFLRYTAGILSVCLAFTLASCGDDNDNDYTPGAPTAEGAVGAYFDSSNSKSFILEPEDESVEVSVSRKDTTGAAVVPITLVSCDTAAITVPDKVEFQAGEKTKTLTISTKNLNHKKEYGFKLAIGESAADHYAIQDGATTYSSTVVVSQWEKVKEGLKFYYKGNDRMPVTYSDLYQLDGVNQFYLTNFMGSGVSMYFSISSKTLKVDNPETWAGELVPVNGKGAAVYDYGYYKMNYVWLGSDDNGADIFNWSVDGVNINYFDWYGGYDYAADSYINYSQNYIYLNGYVSSDVTENYVEVYGSWE